MWKISKGYVAANEDADVDMEGACEWIEGIDLGEEGLHD